MMYELRHEDDVDRAVTEIVVAAAHRLFLEIGASIRAAEVARELES
jgi:hypothetical protein